jgi:tRNA A37 methylthiotransferase MiaB
LNGQGPKLELLNKNYILKTLGCKANLYDSQILESELQKRGWSPYTDSSMGGVQLCIINSCTVTDEADRQTHKMAARLEREHSGTTVVVTGCAAEVNPEGLARSPGIHYVIGNQDKPELVEIILQLRISLIWIPLEKKYLERYKTIKRFCQSIPKTANGPQQQTHSKYHPFISQAMQTKHALS